MPDPTLSDALKEAYASAPVGEVIYVTAEFRHSLLESPIRVVCDSKDLEAFLEEDAPENGGEEVFFTRYAFDLQKPEVSATGVPTATLTIDNVSREIVAAIETVCTSRESLKVTFREYLQSDLSKPQNDPPITMEVLDITADMFRITAQIGMPNYANKRFPTTAYTTEVYPGLVL